MEGIAYLFDDISLLAQVNASYYDKLCKLIQGNRIIDLLLHRPTKIHNLSIVGSIKNVDNNSIIIIPIVPIKYDNPNKNSKFSKRPFKVYCLTENNEHIIISFFNPKIHYIKSLLKIGIKKVVIGKVSSFCNVKQINNPQAIYPYSILLQKDLQKEIIYPMTQGLRKDKFISILKSALQYLPLTLPEWIPEKTLIKYEWDNFKNSLLSLHNPKSNQCMLANSKTIARLAYDELLAYNILLRQSQNSLLNTEYRIIKSEGNLFKKLLLLLPFSLTEDQKTAIQEISRDQKSSIKMLRLLHGDVGSGKTIVAISAILNVIESGAQAVLMAPTEVLAKQHYTYIKDLLDNLNITVSLITGNSSDKRKTLQNIKNNNTNVIIGTHALFQDKIFFHDLALVVIDEQHRFGVEQREKLSTKGNNADILLMSATPIPRTLALTIYKDIKLSTIQNKPKERLPVITAILNHAKISTIIKKIQDNRYKTYWVCPTIHKSEDSNIMSIQERSDYLQQYFDNNTLLILHGEMPQKDKDNVMNSFINKKFAILLATSVIEVGVNVPDTTLMIIENSERFGLSQLHQLRGRVGRGNMQSYCILLYTVMSNRIQKRLEAIRNSQDGFYIAEQDLLLRGEGNLLGTRQSGIPYFKFADIILHKELLSLSAEQADKIINNENILNNIKILLDIFRNQFFLCKH